MTRRLDAAARAYLVGQLLGWSAWAGLGMGYAVVFGWFGPAQAANGLLCAAAGMAVTHLLHRRIQARRWLELPVRRLLPRLAIAAGGAALVLEAAGFVFGVFVTRVHTLAGSTPGVLCVTTLQWLSVTVVWVALYAAVHFFGHWRRAEIARLGMEVAARQAQLDALRAQLNPHFLFNALNSLRALIAERPERARDLVTELSDLLRYALQAGRRERVSLSEELAAVEDYLQLESVRLEERLRWRVDASAETRALALPPMLLQGLVENAVKHGIAPRPQGGEVAVAASRAGGRLELSVASTGALEPGGTRGIGLANARERLRLLYGDAAALELLDTGAGVVEARVVLPAEAP